MVAAALLAEVALEHRDVEPLHRRARLGDDRIVELALGREELHEARLLGERAQRVQEALELLARAGALDQRLLQLGLRLERGRRAVVQQHGHRGVEREALARQAVEGLDRGLPAQRAEVLLDGPLVRDVVARDQARDRAVA